MPKNKDETVTVEFLHSIAKARLFRKPSASFLTPEIRKQSLKRSNVQADLLTPDTGPLLRLEGGIWGLR